VKTAETRYTLEEVLAAVEKGITKTGTAHVLGCTRQTIIKYAKRWASVAAAFESKRVELVDLSELALRGAVIRQEPWAVTFALRTLGKNEGYCERQEITGENGRPLQVEHGISSKLLADKEANRLAHALLSRLAGDAGGDGAPADEPQVAAGEAPGDA